MTQTRPAAVAGAFYPARPDILTADLDELLQEASPPPAIRPKALIVPHAGYVYSGPVAASAYRLLEPLRGQITRVVLLGPVHRVPIRGLALPGVDAFATPLGEVRVDRDTAARLFALPQVGISDPAHAWEHSLEVQLPFLQRVLGDFELVPLAVGDASAEQVAEVIESLWGGPETLILVSSDLSHYLPYKQAKETDQGTARSIVDLKPPISHEQACGGTPVNGLLLVARRRHLTPTLLDLRNSGDTAGDRSRVVGYGAFAFEEQ